MNSIIVIMGQRPTWLKMLLSPALAAEYKRQIPAAKNPFCCCDCGASFHHMHMLANHIQTAHVEPLPTDDENTNMTQWDFLPLDLQFFSPPFFKLQYFCWNGVKNRYKSCIRARISFRLNQMFSDFEHLPTYNVY